MIVRNFIEASTSIEVLRQIATLAFAGSGDESLDKWFSFDVMREMIEGNRGSCLIAYDNNEAVGFIYAQQENPINGLEGIEKWVIVITAIHTDFAGKGFGTSLLSGIEQVAMQNSAKKIFVYTNEDDEKVIHFYEKNGYIKAGRIQDYQYGLNNSPIFLLKHLRQIRS